MQHKTFLFSLLLLVPTLFMGQVLQEINQESQDLPDPDQYPLEVYFKVGPPLTAISASTGYKNMRQLIDDGELEFNRFREMTILEGGMRYKRFYLDIGGAIEFGNTISDPVSNGFSSLASTSSTVWMGCGYSVWQDRNSALLIHLGLGQMRSSVDIRQVRNINPIDFNTLYADGAGNPSTLLYHENAFWDIGVEWWQGRAKNRVNAGETLRFGYRRGINETAWKSVNTSSLNAPMDRIGELYMYACFHLGRAYPTKG